MKVSEIPVKYTITSGEIEKAYLLGMKNVYPDDKVPVYELQKFPLPSYISDIDLKTTSQLIQRMRNISAEVDEQKEKLIDLVNNVQEINASIVNNANLQENSGVVEYDDITSQMVSKYATPDELQAAVNNVYSELFSAVEEMMVQVFTTSMYARQYKPMLDSKEINEESSSDDDDDD